MKYILIQNEGEIESNSFELIGASTKRDEKGKIGFFGSGLKYSIAYMMRTGIDFKVFSGEKELKFTTTPETLKDKSFDRICINGKPTSYTTTMGPTWKEDWFILREIYCNAIDEGTCTLVKSTEIIQAVAGKTRIYIQLTDNLEKVVINWNSYFADEREPVFVTDKNIYTASLGSDDAFYRQSVKVYGDSGGILYRKGIRVYDNDKYLYDYSLDYININEDRTARSPGLVDYGFHCMAVYFCNEDWIKSVLRTGHDDKPCHEYSAFNSHNEESFSEKWVEFSKQNMLVVRERSAKYSDEILATKKEVFLLPATFSRSLKKALPQVCILGMGNSIGHTFSEEVEMTGKMNFLLKEVLNALNEMKYSVPFDIVVVDFEDQNVLGKADAKEKKILLSQRVFEMGRREIALTLIEENEHIKSGKEDETRGFESHLISQWLKTMEDSSALFL